MEDEGAEWSATSIAKEPVSAKRASLSEPVGERQWLT